MAIELKKPSQSTMLRWAALAALCSGVASCGTTQIATTKKQHGKEYFSEKEYGVKASPRVATGKNIPKGGGRAMVGDPYQVKGVWYYPKEDKSYNKVGVASWYGSAFHGRLTANGEVYNQNDLTAAHPTFPLPSYARVTNIEDGSSVIVRVNDRGPYHPGRIIDLSNKTASLLDLKDSGTGEVRVQYVGRAPLDAHDAPYLMASYIPKGGRFPGINPGGGQIASGVMVASSGSSITADELPDMAPRPSRRAAPVKVAVARPAPAPLALETIAYSGSTPLRREMQAAVPQGWGGPVPVLASAPVDQGLRAGLPSVGPVPRERPSGALPMASLAPSFKAGYAEEPSKVAERVPAFDAVMGHSGRLTQESIKSAYERYGRKK